MRTNDKGITLIALVITIIILIIILIGIYYTQENFDVSNVLTGIVGGSLLYLCSPCICSCCMFIILFIFLKLMRK